MRQLFPVLFFFFLFVLPSSGDDCTIPSVFTVNSNCVYFSNPDLAPENQHFLLNGKQVPFLEVTKDKNGMNVPNAPVTFHVLAIPTEPNTISVQLTINNGNAAVDSTGTMVDTGIQVVFNSGQKNYTLELWNFTLTNTAVETISYFFTVQKPISTVYLSPSGNVNQFGQTTSTTLPTSLYSLIIGEFATTSNVPIIVGVLVGIGIPLIVAVIVIPIVIVRKKRKGQQINIISREEIDELGEVIIGEKIGSGNYGDVFKGNYNGTPCACKKLKNPENFADFFKEAKTLKKLSHPNIILFIGLYTDKDGNKYMVFEYASEGTLQEYINKRGDNLSSDDILDIIIGAARGMAYLEQKQIIHRDLACRNLLVSESGVIKVSDFGMARDNTYVSNDQTRFPVRWTSPEVLKQGKATSKSDVYSFGVVIWEIFERGKLPFSELSNIEVVNQVCANGSRLSQPPRCSNEIYQLMLKCWSFNPEDRPTFKDLLNALDGMKTEKPGSSINKQQSSSLLKQDILYANTPSDVSYSKSNF